MDIRHKQRVMWKVIHYLLDRKYVDIKTLNDTLPKDKIEEMDKDELLESFIQVLGLQDISKELSINKVSVNEWKWL
jgi:hypothetical protein